MNQGNYKKVFAIEAQKLSHLLNELYLGHLNLGRLNYGVITLLPKVAGATNIKQYRPICLLNVIFKLITKILTIRLTPVAARIVSKVQTAFTPGRFILEGVVLIHEILHELDRSKEKGIVLKLDFKKAYDKVRWPFLVEVLEGGGGGFNARWIGWIRAGVESGKVCINLNGENGAFFRTFKGLRQWDPLSPLLFNLVGDALGAMLKAAKEAGHVEELVPHLIPGGVSHLQYADDTVLFLRYDDQSVRNVKFLLYCFEEMSGLKINYHKRRCLCLGLRMTSNDALLTS